MPEMEKWDIEITTDDGRINSGSKRFKFYSRQTQLYLFPLILLAFGILAFTIIQIILYHPPANFSESELKSSPQNGYEKYTQITLENNEIDPCGNFYNFACQAWQKENPKPKSQYKWTVFAVQYYKINKLVIDILEKPIQHNDLDAIIQAKNLYKKCLTDKITLHSVNSGIIGQTGYPVINELCKDSVKNIFNIALAHQMAVLKYGDIDQLENIRTEVQQMFDNIRNSFNQMDTSSLSKSIDQTKLCVGLPVRIFNRTRVQAEYTELKLDTKQAYSYQMDAANHWLRKLNSEQKSNYNSECPWYDSMGYESAYYLRSKNLIYLPMGLLEPPYFSQNQSEDQNYGSLGTIIGHELAHAYLVPNADSIKNSTLTCLQSQYNSFTRHQQKSHLSLRLDPTIHENLADNLGLGASYNARFRSGPVQDAQKEINHTWNVQKPNGQFTDEQLFFLSFAQKYCESPNSKVMRLEEHSPGMSRVLGALQNSKQFAKAWSCPAGSIMNPSPSEHRKCQFVKK